MSPVTQAELYARLDGQKGVKRRPKHPPAVPISSGDMAAILQRARLLEAERARIQAIVESIRAEALRIGWDEAQTLGGGFESFTLQDPDIRHFMDQGQDRVSAVNEHTQDLVSHHLASGLNAGFSIEDTINGVAENGYPGLQQSPAFSDSRLRTIARTETRIAENQGMASSFNQQGYHVVDITDGPGCGWTSHDDSLTANGRRVEVEEWMNQPIAHPNCVRSAIPFPCTCRRWRETLKTHPPGSYKAGSVNPGDSPENCPIHGGDGPKPKPGQARIDAKPGTAGSRTAGRRSPAQRLADHERMEELFGLGEWKKLGDKAPEPWNWAGKKANLVGLNIAKRLEGDADWQKFVDKLSPKLLNKKTGKYKYHPDDPSAASASFLLQEWIAGAEGNPWTFLQEMAREEFGLNAALMGGQDSRKALKWGAGNEAGARRFLREMYNNTQDHFKGLGIDEIVLYRGVKMRPGIGPGPGQTLTGSVEMQPISSFTTRGSYAATYARPMLTIRSTEDDYGLVIRAVVPIERIIGTGASGFGSLQAAEFTVFGSHNDTWDLHTWKPPKVKHVINPDWDPNDRESPRTILQELEPGIGDQPPMSDVEGFYDWEDSWDDRIYGD